MSLAMAELFQRLSCGVYVVGVAAGDRKNAFTAAWVMPVSFQPLLLALSIHPEHSSYALLKEGTGFSVNVLRRDQIDLAAWFGAPRATDKLAGIAWHGGRTGAPLLEDALARFECIRVAEYPAGDHGLVLGQVLDGVVLQAEAEPLLYRQTGNLDGAAALFPEGFPDWPEIPAASIHTTGTSP